MLVADGAGVPWSALGLAGRTTGEGGTPVNATVWKLFSREPLPHAWLSMMFERGGQVPQQGWPGVGASTCSHRRWSDIGGGGAVAVYLL